MTTYEEASPQSLCACGHKKGWHHGLGSFPCGVGACDCRKWLTPSAPKPMAPVVATNLWGEAQVVNLPPEPEP